MTLFAIEFIYVSCEQGNFKPDVQRFVSNCAADVGIAIDPARIVVTELKDSRQIREHRLLIHCGLQPLFDPDGKPIPVYLAHDSIFPEEQMRMWGCEIRKYTKYPVNIWKHTESGKMERQFVIENDSSI
jgi:hypothetical protein